MIQLGLVVTSYLPTTCRSLQIFCKKMIDLIRMLTALGRLDITSSGSDFLRGMNWRDNICSSNYSGVVGTSRHLFTFESFDAPSGYVLQEDILLLWILKIPRVNLIECGDDTKRCEFLSRCYSGCTKHDLISWLLFWFGFRRITERS